MRQRVSRRNLLALVAILAAAVNLRIGVTEIGPLLDRIRAEMGMSATLAGALGAVPFLCMGVFALLGMRIVVAVRPRRLVAACLLLLAGGTFVRAVAPTPVLLIVTTVPIGIAIALIGLALPGVVKARFPDRTGAAMGGYVAAMSVGASVAALTMVPLADRLGSWRAALAISVLPTLLSVPLWLLLPHVAAEEALQAESAAVGAVAARGRFAAPRHSALLGVVFGMQAICFAGLTNWIAALYHRHGWTSGHAGLTTAFLSMLVIPGALVIPALSDRGDRRRWVLGSALTMSVGLVGLAFAPTALPWVWITAFGIGNGAMFPLCLTLPQDMEQNERARTELTAWMLGIGYVLSATGPLLVGGLLDLTGRFEVPIALLAAIGTFSGLLAMNPALKRRAPEPASLQGPDPRTPAEPSGSGRLSRYAE